VVIFLPIVLRLAAAPAASLLLGSALAFAPLIVAAETAQVQAGTAAGLGAAAAFERLKSLAGEWTGTAGEGGGSPATITYRVTAAGSAVVETLMPGSPHEMVTVYHRDGDALVLTHYCAMGNQPHMRLDVAASTADRLVFAFAGGANLDPAVDAHMHSGELRLLGPDRLEGDWTAYKDGKQTGTHRFVLTRSH
jgi:hypothetical protein